MLELLSSRLVGSQHQLKPKTTTLNRQLQTRLCPHQLSLTFGSEAADDHKAAAASSPRNDKTKPATRQVAGDHQRETVEKALAHWLVGDLSEGDSHQSDAASGT
jgi:hypothetical protein